MRAALILLLWLSSSVAAAQDAPDPRDVTVARQEFRAGIEAARAGRWEDARARFARSYQLNPRLSALFNLAGAQAQTGQLVAAAESYREYLSRRDEERAAEAEERLAELEGRIPTIVVRVSLAEGDELSLDGEPLRRLLLDSPIPVDPGAHRVAVTRGEAEVASEAFEVAEGGSVELALDVPPAPVPAVTAEATPTEPEARALPELVAATPEEPEREPNVLEQWWLWTIVGVVVVGAVAASVAIALTPGQPLESSGFGVDLVRVP